MRPFTLVVLGALAACGLLVYGCAPSEPSVAGTIQVDGEPLAKGSIDLVPVEGTAGPGGGTVIQAGKYWIDKGLAVGKYRIEIQGTRKTNKKVPDPLIATNLVYEEVPVVPPKYNSKSTLFKEVGAGSNTIDFELEGIKKSR